jgi:hypothetical protein
VRLGFDLFSLVGNDWMFNLRLGGTLRRKRRTVSQEGHGE